MDVKISLVNFVNNIVFFLIVKIGPYHNWRSNKYGLVIRPFMNLIKYNKYVR